MSPIFNGTRPWYVHFICLVAHADSVHVFVLVAIVLETLTKQGVGDIFLEGQGPRSLTGLPNTV